MYKSVTEDRFEWYRRLHRKNDFNVSKDLTKYWSENNFVGLSKSLCKTLNIMEVILQKVLTF